MKKNIIITAGGTIEPIDGVRSITNFSTGRLGAMIGDELLKTKKEEIGTLFYISPTTAAKPEEDERITFVTVTDVASVKKNIEEILKNNEIHYFIHSMAVSDYTTDYVSNAKMIANDIVEKMDKKLNDEQLVNQIEEIIKENENRYDTNKKVSSSEDNLIIKLKQTPKIISLIKSLSSKTCLVGFKLLNNVSEEELVNVAYRILEKNDCDYVVANDLKNIHKNKHEAILMDKQNNKVYATTKKEIAEKLVQMIWK